MAKKKPANNRDKQGKFIRGKSGNPTGKQKGTKDKFTELKDSFLEAFDRLGGVDGLVEWAGKNNLNRGHFYQMITKLLPKDINLNPPSDLTFIIGKGYKPKVKGKK